MPDVHQMIFSRYLGKLIVLKRSIYDAIVQNFRRINIDMVYIQI